MTTKEQLKILSKDKPSFDDAILPYINGEKAMTPLKFSIFQMNIGKKCNQACLHCHVGASPVRTEMMSQETIERCLEIIASVASIETVDITGGAPEMNPNFRYLVTEAKKLGKHVMDRCNLTILEEPGYEYLYNFLSENNVEIVASLPYFRKSYTDRQRGRGVFEKSVTALKRLNKLGYGLKNGRILNLVYNPAGAFLSAGQKALEREFKENLSRQYKISFNNLFCINNMPLDRFLRSLIKADKLDEYMDLLKNYFNPATLDGLMCRHQVSVSYDGYIYDCDFNQMLNLKAKPVSHIDAFDYDAFISRKIATANHCFGCTAGAGSSCGGEIA
jgi:radical SAM/Cys-rich protein